MSSITCFAPGRVEILGNHTDYNEGFVLSASLPYGIRVTGSKRDDGTIRLSTHMGSELLQHEVSVAAPFVRSGEWYDYPLGVVAALREAGINVGGFHAEFVADLPSGAGLSSSAAMEVSTIMLLEKLHHIALPGIELAKLCRRAENEFVGMQCGILDQVSSLFGKQDHAIFLDCNHRFGERVHRGRRCLVGRRRRLGFLGVCLGLGVLWNQSHAADGTVAGMILMDLGMH